MATTNLNLVEIAVGQVQKEVTHNQALDEIDKAIGTLLVVPIGSSNARTLTSVELRQNHTFSITDDSPAPTAAITLTVPAIARGSIAVSNNTSFAVSVTIASQPAAAPVVDPSTTKIIIIDGINAFTPAGGAAAFTSLTDTPSAYAGSKGKIATVNDAETALIFGSGVSAKLNSSSFKQSFQGALLELSTDVVVADQTDVQVPWASATYDTTFTNDLGVTNQKFWLGVDLTFTAATTDIVTATSHGMTNGDGPLRLTTTGTLPAGLALVTNYWVIFIDTNTFKLALTRVNALAGTAVDITDTGSGTHTLDRAKRIVIPTGVTRIRLAGGASFSDPASTGVIELGLVTFKKNESFVYDGRSEEGRNLVDGTGQTSSFSLKSPVLNVSEGDRFELNVFQNNETEDNSLNLLTGSTTFLGIEVVESDIVTIFPQVMVEKGFAGALVLLTTDQTPPAFFPTGVAWDTVSYDTGFEGSAFWSSGNSSRLTIPVGVTKVRVKGLLSIASGYAINANIGVVLTKVGSAIYDGVPLQEFDSGSASPDINLSSAVLEVTSGDYFEFEIFGDDATFTMGTRSWFSIEVVESTQVLTFPGVTVDKSFVGALVNKTGSQSLTTAVLAEVTWDNTVYDTGFKGTLLFSDANEAFVIPAGVTRIRLTTSLLGLATTVLSEIFIQFQKNDANFIGMAINEHGGTIAAGNDYITVTSPVIDVVTGDSFTVDVKVTGTGTVSIPIDTSVNIFAIEIIETDDDAFPPEQVETVLLADSTALLINRIQYKKVASRRFSLKDEFAGSVAHAGTAPTSTAQIFDVKRNGTIIGTITFAVASQTATFTTTGGTQEDFDPDDRLTIETQGTVNTVIRDISINLFSFRT